MLEPPSRIVKYEAHELGSSDTIGTIFNVARYSIHDGPGIRTTVFLKGCPLHCWWCHNPEGQSPRPQLVYRSERCIHCLSCAEACPHHAIVVVDDVPTVLSDKCTLSGACVRVCQSGARELAGKQATVGNIMGLVEKDTVFYDESGGGVTFSGGEPFAQPIFLQTLLRLCKERRIHTVVETCGYVNAATLLGSSANVDLYLYDLKVIDSEKHQKFTGVSNKVILENLRLLSNSHNQVIVRVPLIPGVNDQEEDISQLGEFVSSLRSVKEVDVLPYHELGIEKYKRLGMEHKMPEVQPLSGEGVNEIADRLRNFGLSVKIGG